MSQSVFGVRVSVTFERDAVVSRSRESSATRTRSAVVMQASEKNWPARTRAMAHGAYLSVLENTFYGNKKSITRLPKISNRASDTFSI